MEMHEITGLVIIAFAIMGALLTRFFIARKINMPNGKEIILMASYLTDVFILLFGVAVYLGHVFK